jgi:hypothetical protein
MTKEAVPALRDGLLQLHGQSMCHTWANRFFGKQVKQPLAYQTLSLPIGENLVTDILCLIG